MGRNYFFVPMEPIGSTEVTQLLRAWGGGDREALDRLTPKIYGELKRIAHGQMFGQFEADTMQTSALVNEAYLRMVDAKNVTVRDRLHFFAMSARMMRWILVDRARARIAGKRGGGAARVNLDEIPDQAPKRDNEIVALDAALEQLAKVDPRKVQVIEMRYFSGLSVEETAAALDVSPQTVMRDWKLAKAWLARELSAK